MFWVKYLVALWIAVMFYAVSSILVGVTGFSAYSQLYAEKEKLVANIQRLQAMNKEFTEVKEALLYDADTIQAHARELGYGDKAEQFVRIAGISGKSTDRMSSGDYFFPTDPVYVGDKTLRIVSLALAFSMALCIGVVDLLRHVKES